MRQRTRLFKVSRDSQREGSATGCKSVACKLLGSDAVSGGVLKSRAMLVDDHPLFRTGLAITLAKEPDLHVTADVGSAVEALEAMRASAIDIAVIDVLMPTTTGVSLAAELLELRPSCKILALSVLDEPMIIATMLRAGALGYALKTQPPNEITQAIRIVLSGARYLPPFVSHEAVLGLVADTVERPMDRLTRREREVFDLLIRGHSNDEIATRLFISRRTVETHRQRITKKLATHSILDMIRLAARQGALCD
ncbi:MAG TPA: response regulator transcription factor [Kofleriaceae bacterium]|nr:response regulator transcription factor [Kofleriaceae bacterium]